MKAAMIGLGMVSDTYGDAFARTDAVDLSLIYSPSHESRAKYLAKWPGPQAVDSLGSIAESDVDFVVLTTPPNARDQIVRALTAAGKPILMEKPIERTLPASDALVTICEDAGVPLGMVLQHRARPVVADLRRLLPDLGAMHMVEVIIAWWRDQAYYDEPGRGSYARDGGGVLITQAIHILDLMLSLTGPVADVNAMTATSGFHQMEGEDFVAAGVQYDNGAVGHIFATTASYPGRGESITLHCANGSAHLTAGELHVTWQDGRTDSFGQAAASGAGANPMAFKSDWHRFIIEDFAEAVTTGRAPMVTGREALEVHRLIDAIERSAKVGGRVKVS